jgi:1,4-alpha-glucan branching enzyme
MPGDEWQRFANLRAYYGLMWTWPGKKLLFMGGEFAQEHEWDHDRSLDWHLLDDPKRSGVQALVRDLNCTYAATPPLHELDCDPAGFEWIDPDNAEMSLFSYVRRSRDGGHVVVVANFTPVVRHGFRIGVPEECAYREMLNTDDERYGGSGVGNPEPLQAEAIGVARMPYSVALSVPPLATIVLAPQRG